MHTLRRVASFMRKSRIGLLFFLGEFRVQKVTTQMNSEVLDGQTGSNTNCIFIELKLSMAQETEKTAYIYLNAFYFA